MDFFKNTLDLLKRDDNRSLLFASGRLTSSFSPTSSHKSSSPGVMSTGSDRGGTEYSLSTNLQQPLQHQQQPPPVNASPAAITTSTNGSVNHQNGNLSSTTTTILQQQPQTPINGKSGVVGNMNMSPPQGTNVIVNNNLTTNGSSTPHQVVAALHTVNSSSTNISNGSNPNSPIGPFPNTSEQELLKLLEKQRQLRKKRPPQQPQQQPMTSSILPTTNVPMSSSTPFPSVSQNASTNIKPVTAANPAVKRKIGGGGMIQSVSMPSNPPGIPATKPPPKKIKTTDTR
ncbi:hypothetical protein FDP41_009617 [Naegleria fowleri]|uniref:Uncharacterized protein n=1 Tax=Naegleria fowleri TaxID=5763 RepID=A0A6A5BAL7_NAEFO|nr:uncharacterized protein FDP41_009617 [Naegleria fowleri]KAF0971921.1 hypothetical protein FDP41_009617 [Naegleria fowleri]